MAVCSINIILLCCPSCDSDDFWRCSQLQPSERRKPLKSVLALGKCPKKEQLMIIHFTSVHPTGFKYNVHNNILRVFTKFVQEGKATISFKEPAHDLLIKADPADLKSFLSVFKCGVEKKTLPGALYSVSDVPKQLPKVQTSLVVNDRSQYPKKLPSTLESLELNQLKIKEINSHILQLHRLHTLRMCHNELSNIPEVLNTLPKLRNIDFSYNNLGACTSWKWLGGNLSTSLISLDLSFNNLDSCPTNLSMLKQLQVLILKNNRLKALPTRFGALKTLHTLNISNNQIEFIPSSLMKIRFELVDISGNKCSQILAAPILPKSLTFSLLDLSAQTILENNIYYSHGMLPAMLINFLNNSAECLCGRAVVNRRLRAVRPSHFSKPKVVVQDRDQVVNIEVFFCTIACYLKYVSYSSGLLNV